MSEAFETAMLPPSDIYNREAWKAYWKEKPPSEKVNWSWYICRGCNQDGNAHMISLQARLELCDTCYYELPKAWRVKRGDKKETRKLKVK